MMHTVCGGTVGNQMPFEEHLRFVRELGYREVDLVLVSDWVYFSTDELQKNYSVLSSRIEKALMKNDLSAASFNVKLSVPLEHEDLMEKRNNEMDAVLRLMKEFGTDRLSIISAQTTDEEYLASIFDNEVEELNRLRLRAAEKGVKMCLEPHILTSFCHTSAIRDVLQKHPDFLVTFDPSHFLHYGEKTQDAGFIAQHTGMVHLRDARKDEMFTPYGEGSLDLPYCIEKLSEAGYSGPISMEFIIDYPDDRLLANMYHFKTEVESLISRYSL